MGPTDWNLREPLGSICKTASWFPLLSNCHDWRARIHARDLQHRDPHKSENRCLGIRRHHEVVFLHHETPGHHATIKKENQTCIRLTRAQWERSWSIYSLQIVRGCVVYPFKLGCDEFSSWSIDGNVDCNANVGIDFTVILFLTYP